MQDPISDMIARVKNAQSRGHKEVLLDSSKIKLGICKVLESEGYIKKVDERTRSKTSINDLLRD
jgi:small subunit ribosomal protein S8